MPLKESLLKLVSHPLVIPVLKSLTKQTGDIGSELYKTIVRVMPGFSESSNPQVLPDLEKHLRRQAGEILRLLDGGRIEDFSFVHDYARDCATCYFPLETILHAYRFTHKFYTGRLNDTLLASSSNTQQARDFQVDWSDFMLEYIDTISLEFTRTYVEQDRILAAGGIDHRAKLLSLLLQGHDESDARIKKTLHNAGYLDRRQSYCVALAQSVDPSEMFHPGRARRLADAIDNILQNTPSQRLIDLHDNKVVIVFSHIRRISGWSAPHSQLAQRLKSELLAVGNAALIGVSNDVPSTSQIPSAYREAKLALELANVTRRVVQISELPLQVVMLHLARERLQPVLPAWRHDFFAANDRLRGALVKTLRAYAQADMNILKAAQALTVHPNTMYSRMQKIIDITGLNARNYDALTELLVIVELRANETLQ